MLQRTSTARIALAAAAAAVAGLALSRAYGAEQESFLYTLPLLMVGAGSIAARAEARVGAELSRALFGCALVIPALNAWIAALLIRMDASRYLQPVFGLAESMSGAAYVLRASGPLLFAASLGALLALGRRGLDVTLPILAGALGARIGRALLQTAATRLAEGDAVAASWLCAAGAFSGMGLSFLVWLRLTWRPGTRVTRLARLLLATMAGVAGSAPVAQLVWLLPAPRTALEVPAGAPGLSYTSAPLDLRADLIPQLLSRNQGPVSGPAWVCVPAGEGDYTGRLRVSMNVALPESAPAALLLEARPVLAVHGVGELVLIGRSAPTMPLFDDWMGWPGAPIWLDRPERLRWVLVEPGGWRWVGPASSEPVCGVFLGPDTTIGDLYRAIRTLARPGEPCAGGVALAAEGSPERPPAEGCPQNGVNPYIDVDPRPIPE